MSSCGYMYKSTWPAISLFFLELNGHLLTCGIIIHPAKIFDLTHRMDQLTNIFISTFQKWWTKVSPDLSTTRRHAHQITTSRYMLGLFTIVTLRAAERGTAVRLVARTGP